MAATKTVFKCTCGSDEKCKWAEDKKTILRVADDKPHIHLEDQVDKTKIEASTQDPELPEFAKVHHEIWTFAYEAAKAVYQGTDFDSQKNRMILAQVYYKKCFDAKIHGVMQKQPNK